MLELFGSLAGASMVLCYALEDRGAVFGFAFAASCGLAALYAFAIGSMPFFALETVWAAVATRRALRRLG